MDGATIVGGVMIALAGTAAIAIAVRSPFHAFCVFLATLPFENALAIKGPLTITPAYLALLLTVVVSLRHRNVTFGSLRSPIDRFVLGYLAIAVASLVMTIAAPPPPVTATSDLLRWRAGEYRSIAQVAFLLFSAGAFFITVYFCSTPERLRIATRMFIGVVGVTALYGLFQIVGVRYRLPLVGPYAGAFYETPASLRPNATFQEAMNFGHFLVAGLPVLIAFFLHREQMSGSDRRAYSIVALPMIVVMVAALLLTIGRAAWVGFFVACLVVILASDRSVRLRALALGGLSAAAAAPILLFAFGSLNIALITVLNRFQLGGVALEGEQRLWYFPFLLSLFREHPILGVGYGNYPVYQVFAFGLYGIAGAYGVFWQALVETGVIGFAALVALLGSALIALGRAVRTMPGGEWRPYLVGWLGSIAGLSISYFFFGDRFSLYMWVALGLAMSTVRMALSARVDV